MHDSTWEIFRDYYRRPENMETATQLVKTHRSPCPECAERGEVFACFCLGHKVVFDTEKIGYWNLVFGAYDDASFLWAYSIMRTQKEDLLCLMRPETPLSILAEIAVDFPEWTDPPMLASVQSQIQSEKAGLLIAQLWERTRRRAMGHPRLNPKVLQEAIRVRHETISVLAALNPNLPPEFFLALYQADESPCDRSVLRHNPLYELLLLERPELKSFLSQS